MGSEMCIRDRAAVEVVARHGGELPAAYDELIALPGVGTYTAAAVATFAHGERHAVLDTNVRRVLVRAGTGRAEAAPALTAAERRLGESVVPEEPSVAARWAVAVMELGALVCTARAPRCDHCPLRPCCAWQQAGRPAYDGPPRRRQGFVGTDRQVRGLLMGVLREAPGAVPAADLERVWPDADQRHRSLLGLVADGLLETDGDYYRLPGLAAGR